MPAVQVQCPSCSRSYSVDSQLLGNIGRCRKCGAKFSLAPSAGSGGGGSGTSAAIPAPTIPETIGRFAVRARLGSGAFGAVYRAHDPDLDREVALKVPHPGAMDDPRAVERFLREAKATARLRHPNIVPVFEIGVTGTTYYIASAFIQGRTLAQAVAAGPLDPRIAAGIAADLAAALQSAHDLGIVHRDVKPLNIMLDDEGRPLLMDFGLARWDGSAERLTQDGAILGTPAYMAPEQATGKSGQADSASDQYALGVTLYEMLCGRVPFSGPMAVVIFNSVHTEPPAPSSIRAAIPPELEAICLKAMAKDPKARYPSAKALAADLRDWLAGRTTVVATAAPPRSQAPPSPVEAVEDSGSIPPLGLVIDSEPSLGSSRPKPAKPRAPSEEAPRRRVPTSAGVAAIALACGAIWWIQSRPQPPPAGPGVAAASPAAPEPGRAAPAAPEPERAAPEPPGTGPRRALAVASIDPNRSLRPEELRDPGLQAPFKARSPRLDGVIEPDEYGPALAVAFDATNLGRVTHGQSKGPEDLGAHLFTAYTPTHLFVAVRVRDDDVIGRDDPNPVHGDHVSLFLDGDNVPNDFRCVPGGGGSGREGFQLILDSRGHRASGPGGPTSLPESDWEGAAKRCPGGYVVEFGIPLAHIDTKDGAGEVPAREGSTIGFNLAIMDWHGSGINDWKFAALEIDDAAMGRIPVMQTEADFPLKLHLGAIGLQADYRPVAPDADGEIKPDEYGPPLPLNFIDKGNPAWLYWGARSDAADFSGRLHTAYSDDALHVAVEIRDATIETFTDVNLYDNDSVALFLDGDRVPNDIARPGQEAAAGNREGFVLIADAAGRRSGSPIADGGSDWRSTTRRTAGGYTVEFRIPFDLIDTEDGPGVTRAGPGSTLRIEMRIADADDQGKRNALGNLWHERGSGRSASPADESSWLVDLHLARKVVYELAKGPPGATIDPASGLVSWASRGRAETITVTARDALRPGLASSRDFTVMPDGSAFPRTGDPLASARPGDLLPPMLILGAERAADAAPPPAATASPAPSPSPPTPPPSSTAMASNPPARPASGPRAYLLQTFDPKPGKLKALTAALFDAAPTLVARHGIDVAGAWTTQEDKGAPARLVALLAVADREAGDVEWARFKVDPAAKPIAALVSDIKSQHLLPQGFAPWAASPRPGRVYQIQTHDLRTFVLNSEYAFWKDVSRAFESRSTLARDIEYPLMRSHGIEVLGRFASREAGSDQFVEILGHPDREAAERAWAAYREDPKYAGLEAALRENGLATQATTSAYLTPVDPEAGLKEAEAKQAPAVGARTARAPAAKKSESRPGGYKPLTRSELLAQQAEAERLRALSVGTWVHRRDNQAPVRFVLQPNGRITQPGGTYFYWEGSTWEVRGASLTFHWRTVNGDTFDETVTLSSDGLTYQGKSTNFELRGYREAP